VVLPQTVVVERSISTVHRVILRSRFPSRLEISVLHDPFDLVDEWGPEKVVLVSDRRSGMRGVLVIDNTARGLGKGGTRMSPTLTVGEVARLARTMTWKWAAVDLFHGGTKAGILGDPRATDKERLLRAFARALANEVPPQYVLGLDLGLAEAGAADPAPARCGRGAGLHRQRRRHRRGGSLDRRPLLAFRAGADQDLHDDL
jgi:hypothetical protein